MKIIRLQQKRFCVVLIFVVVVLYVTHFLRNGDDNDVLDCFISKETLKEIEDLLGLVQQPLKALNVSYFICYDSLWGALKNKAPLPWQNILQLCVLNREMSAIDEGFLARTFKWHGLLLNYNSAGGVYKVTKVGKASPSATLTVFEEDTITHQMRRIGWIHRMLPPNSCEELNCFPPELIAKPLPMVMFGHQSVPAPRDGIEIQKYLFPYTWWKEITPSNCQVLSYV